MSDVKDETKVPDVSESNPLKHTVFKATNPKDLIGTNKLPMSLVPAVTKAFLTVGHLEGHLKYGLVNWREAGVRMSIYLDALERHIEKFKDGDWDDPSTHVPHLANALACISIICDAIYAGKIVDDRPKSLGTSTHFLPEPASVTEVIDNLAEIVVQLKNTFGHHKPVDYFINGPRKRE